MNRASHYDVAIIGAGMSGLAAGIRLAHFGRRVCIFERHYAPGGLNSFYSIDGRKYDVGLHAVTNYVPRGVKGTPLGRLLRQLRIERDEFDLCPQKQSRVVFGPRGGIELRFTNDRTVLETEIASKFPAQIDGFRRLLGALGSYDDTATEAPAMSARAVLRRYISDQLLEDMIFCPLMYYGSAQEQDMDFVQFGVMFRSIFLEGLARPHEGVRRIIRVLLEKYRAAGGERRMKCGVARIIEREGRAAALVLDDGGEITATHVLSSIGAEETMALCGPQAAAHPPAAAGDAPRRLSFIESIRVLKSPPADLGWGDDTIVFFNDSGRFEYTRPAGPVDPRSGVICFPNNFDFQDGGPPEGLLRITCLANYDRWAGLPEERYRAEKQHWLDETTRSARRFLPPVADETLVAATLATDLFTPRTILRFTGHREGAVYGAPHKIRDGHTHLSNLYLCGTDQGLLGIVGSMLSGISMANAHMLRPGADV
ncbi:MAG: FAD-dependent oxidoreductase [Opitutaceae bacterium]|nr:FAD-dependent oxidoreductase [Opitutaceae bacterium]